MAVCQFRVKSQNWTSAHVDSLDIVTEKLLDLLTLDGGVDNNIVSV